MHKKHDLNGKRFGRLAVSGTLLRCNRGNTVSFNPASLVVSGEKHNALLDFCHKYQIEVDKKPEWLLTSWWG